MSRKTSKVPSSPRTLGHPFPLAPPFSVPAFYALPFPPPSREADEGCKKPLERLLNIWQERSVYGGEFIQQLKLSMEDSNKRCSKLRCSLWCSSRRHLVSVSPGQAEDLIKALQDLENAASGDATVRQKIASLPQEVQDVSLLEKITDKEAAERLSKTVDEACLLLAEYNGRLAAELEDRRQLARMLIEYTQTQKDVLTEKEKKLEVSTAALTQLPKYDTPFVVKSVIPLLGALSTPEKSLCLSLILSLSLSLSPSLPLSLSLSLSLSLTHTHTHTQTHTHTHHTTQRVLI
uniref:Regulation of nuclear pre-mRNA domain containing 1B n=1 Tax=Laticauda laticaudata TaxID=8630 RepID=A0A8C5SUJ3_LATLA